MYGQLRSIFSFRVAALAALCLLAALSAGCGTVDERIGPAPAFADDSMWRKPGGDDREFRKIIWDVQSLVREFQYQQGRFPDSLTEMALLEYDIPPLKKGYRYWYDPRKGTVGVEKK